jgi:uncharacterized membrane protein
MALDGTSITYITTLATNNPLLFWSMVFILFCAGLGVIVGLVGLGYTAMRR